MRGELLDAALLAQLHAPAARELHERGVEVAAARDHCVHAAVSRQRERDASSRRRHQHRLAHLCGADVEELRVREPEDLEVAERARGEPVAARLVARELGLVDAHHRAAVTNGGERGRDPARPGTDHGHVDERLHRREGSGARHTLDRPEERRVPADVRPVSTDGAVTCQNHWLRRAPGGARVPTNEESYERRRLREADPRSRSSRRARPPITRSTARES